MHHKHFISIVIPVYNSQDTISSVVEQLINNLANNYQLEIVLVNDGSRDESEQICIALFNKYKGTVQFYSLAKNVGEHSAVMAGLNQTKGDYVVIMDDDFQNPISEVIKLISFATSNDYDVVYTFYDKKKHSFFRNLGSKFNDKVANIMLNKPGDLYLSSFKLMNKFLVNEIINYDLPFPYIDGLILRTTGNIGKVKVNHSERKEGKSGYTFSKLISLWLNMFTNFSILPLRASMMIGFISALGGFLLAILTIIEKIKNPEIPVGYSLTMVAISVFSGFILLAIGMVGEYLGRIFLSQNKKPQFTIRKRFETTKD